MSGHGTGPIVDPAVSVSVEKLLERQHALLTGHFALSSGKHSDRYCQCARLFEDPAAGATVAKLMRDTLPRTLRPQAVLAPALGGVLWGYELARELGARSLFAERDANGTMTLRRGFHLEPGERVVLAEDVITTGKSVSELLPLIEQADADPLAIAAVVDRSKGSFQAPRNIKTYALCELQFNVWEPEDCPMCKAGMPIDKPGSRPDANPPKGDTP